MNRGMPLWDALQALMGMALLATAMPLLAQSELALGPRLQPAEVRPAESTAVFFSPASTPPPASLSSFSGLKRLPHDQMEDDSGAGVGRPTTESKLPSAVVSKRVTPEFPRGIYYKNRLEFGLEGGWLPINIPFVFDVFLGDGYNMTPLKYTLVPIIASVRWQLNNVGGPWIFRGNWDWSFSGSVTAIPRGPESRYFSYVMGIRRNFVPRRGKLAPYFDGRLGLGNIDAKGPDGVAYAQGQNFTFTMNMGSGVRYNCNRRYSISGGLNWMHISNLYLSEPKYRNYGINVYGPMAGINVLIGKPHRDVVH